MKTIEERLAVVEREVKMLRELAELQTRCHVADAQWRKEATDLLTELVDGYEDMAVKMLGRKKLS